MAEAVGSALSDRARKPPRPTRARDFAIWGTPGGRAPSLFFGRLDNAAQAASALRLAPGSSPAEIYDNALEAWGDEADFRLVGHYCAITLEGPQRLRLVRSPWTAPPLHFVSRPDCVAASPLLAALFAAGIEKRIDWDYLVDQLAFDHHDCEPVGWFEGIGRVPLGSRVRISGSEWTLDRYYDPLTIAPVRLPDDEAYVERAIDLLDEAARCALAGIEKPAIMLSGGLDSPLAAVSVLRSLPEGARMASYTFGPREDWDGWVPKSCIGEERDMVRRFAALHPRIEPRFPEARGGHDYALRDLLARTQVPTANIANIGIFHPLFEAAKADGCDAMLTALHGNFNISLLADWAAPEALRKGKLGTLFGLLKEDRAEHSLVRRVLSKALLPQLSLDQQSAVRRFVHPERFHDLPLGSLLSKEAAEAWRKRSRERGSRTAFDTPPIFGSRAQAIRLMWASADSAEDLDLGMERLYGMAHRDVTAYRPLFEFCHGLPTDQLQRGKTDRFLARRMAKGIMPEDQRTETREGRHNVDWHARLSERRTELLARAEDLRSHPELSTIIDLERFERLLQEWPDRTPDDPREQIPREMGLTRALTAAGFVAHVEQRNAF